MGGDNKLGMACMILAMAHQRSGGHAEAVAALQQGLAIVARKSKQPNTGRTLLDWHDWLTFLTLRARRGDWSIRPASRLVRRRAKNANSPSLNPFQHMAETWACRPDAFTF